MNPRQRRGVLFMLVAVLVAGGVFLVVLQYVSSVASAVGPTTTVYRAAEPIAAYETITPSVLVEDEVPTRWLSDSAQVGAEELVDRKVGVAVQEGTLLTSDLLIPTSELSPTEREIAIEVDAVTGIAGRVEPGDFVDIYAVFADVPGLPRQVQVLVRSVRVVSVAGQQTVVEEGEGGVEEQNVVPVTLALEPNDALAVTYADAFAAEVRLVGLPTGTAEDRTGEQDQYDAGNLGGQPIPEEVN